MWEQIIEKVILYMIGVFLPIIGGWIWLQWKKMQAIQESLQMILQSSLIDTHDESVKKGYITIYKRRNFDKKYECYKRLGADGVIDDLVAKVRSLEIVTKVE